MFSFMKWMLPVVALGLVMGLTSTVKAADAKITIKGVVQDKDGKAVEGATVRFSKAMQRGQGGGGGARPEPIATAQTDKDGKFQLAIEKAPADGDYSISTFVQEKGMARVAVTAKEGKLTDKDGKAVSDVTLKLGEMRRRQQ